MKEPIPKCDKCDKPATSAAVDIVRNPTLAGIWHAKPHGEAKYGCDDHPPESNQISDASAFVDLRGSLL